MWPPSSLDAMVSVAMISYKDRQTEKQYIKVAERHKEGTTAVDRLVSENEEVSPAKRQRLNSWVTRKITDVFASYPSEKVTTESPKRILIEGAPGIGKTVLAKDIAYRWSIGEILQNVVILFLLFLRDPQLQQIKSPKELVKYVGMGYFDDDEIANLTAQLKNATQLCFILDGFDEYPDTRKEKSFFIDLIYRGVFPNAIVVITSRPDCTLKLHDQMDKKIEILGLAREDRDQFISRSLCNEDKIIELQRYLKNQPIINGFCYVPLYLAILLFLFQQDFLPENLTEVNKYFIFHTVYRHMNALQQISSSKVVTIIEELAPFYPDFMNKLSKLAFSGLKSDKLIFSTNDLGLCITNDTQNGFGLLQVVEHYPAVGAGNATSFNFIHFTIQEYLAAYYVSTLPHSEQLDKMRETFWKPRYSFMWMMYVGIVGISSTVFIEFISKGAMYKNGSGPKILATIQNDKRKRLQLFQCYMEAKCSKIMPKTISSMFNDGEVRFTNVTLLPHHVSYLTSFMSTTALQWATLDLASSKLDDAAMNVLEQFVVDYAQNASSFKHVDVSENPSSPWSVYCAIVSCCQVSRLALVGDDKHRMEPYMAFLKKSLQINCKLQELSLLGISDKDLSSIKEFLLYYSHSLCTLNVSWKKCADNVIIETSYNINSEINKRAITVRILDDRSYGTLKSKINMSSCKIEDKEITFMSFGLHYNKTLQDLDISKNSIHNSGAVALSNALKENNTLQSLDISKNNLSSCGAKDILEAVQATKTLGKINISEVGMSEPDESIEKAISNMVKGNDTLYSLNLSKNTIFTEGSREISQSFNANATLRILDISHCNLCDDGAVAFSCCLQNNVLEDLNISGNKITNEGIKKITIYIEQNTSLKVLDISDNQINSKGLLYLLRNAKENSSLKLQELFANYNNVTKSDILHIKECGEGLSLKIHVSWNEIIVKKSLIEIQTTLSDNTIVTQLVKNMVDVNHRITLVSSCLAEDKTVKQLSLSKFGITVAGANELSKAIKEKNKVLQALDISGNYLGDKGIAAIIGMLNDTLQELNISENNISCEGAKRLATALESNTALKELKISNNNLTDDGVMAILTFSSNLCKLDFSNTNLSEKGGEIISKVIKLNTHVIHLNLFHTCLANKSRFHEPIFNVLEYNQTLEVLTLPWLDSNDRLQQKMMEINQKREENQIHLLRCDCFRL